MHGTLVVLRRELSGYFGTPVAYVFLIIFLAMAGALTWIFGGFYDRGQADLRAFFNWIPVLFLVLVPALAMRLWAEERRSGTAELLLTLPISLTQAVLGKFFAAWAFVGVALLLTTTNWFTVAYLGEPDHGVIAASYLGSFLMAGGYLAIGGFISAMTKNQVIAFILTLVACFLFMLGGFTGVVEWVREIAGNQVAELVGSFSFQTRFAAISRGVIGMRDLVFFLSLIALFLYANVVAVDLKKAD